MSRVEEERAGRMAAAACPENAESRVSELKAELRRVRGEKPHGHRPVPLEGVGQVTPLVTIEAVKYDTF